jgi:hypothetical protein
LCGLSGAYKMIVVQLVSIPCIKPEVHYFVYKSPLDHILIHLDPVHTLIPYLKSILIVFSKLRLGLHRLHIL